MRTEKNLWFAFGLNLFFSVFEFIGGAVTGSIAIMSDAIHDLADAAGIGIACFMEHKSNHPKDDRHTYGYSRYSVIGGAITTLILLISSVAVTVNAIQKLFSPTHIHYDGMIVFAFIGVAVNLGAALLTRHGHSINQKAINLHMLEDVLGWIVVLVGAVVMRFTGFALLDPLMSIGVALFIGLHALGHMKQILSVLLEKTPDGISVQTIQNTLQLIGGVSDVHHIHLWSMDSDNHYATMHIVTDRDAQQVKMRVRNALEKLGIDHVTIELERPGEICHHRTCSTKRCHCHHH